MHDNLLWNSDSYKVSHERQYEPGTEYIHSYLESRGGTFPWTQVFGPQYICSRYLSGVQVTTEKIDQAEDLVCAHLGNRSIFNRSRWEYIRDAHQGRLPLEVRCVPEGIRVPVHNVLMTVRNTDPLCFWLTNFVETLLVQSWYPITVATLSQHFREMFAEFLAKTGSDPEHLQWMLHDFGFRGVSSVESAAVGGLAHLSTGFRGTDTMVALALGREYYGEPCAGFSVPAYEHSTVTSWGRDREVDCYRHALRAFPTGPLSVVSDSWDIWNAVENIWGGVLREEVMAREGRLIIRPDSFRDIPRDVCRCLGILDRKFPSTTNDLGYCVLDPHVRIIQGDGVDLEMAREVLREMTRNGWAAENIVFGMGGALLQKVNRDTQQFAFKCWEATVNGETRHIYKEPVGMPEKQSKRGRHKLVHGADGYSSVPVSSPGDDVLRTILLDGEMAPLQNLAEIRERAQAYHD